MSAQMAAPASDGCREERPGHVCLQVAVEGRPAALSWVPELDFGPGLPPMGPADLCGIEQSAQTHSFGTSV